MRTEKRPNPPAKGSVTTAASPPGNYCRCGDKAIRRFKNAFRMSDVCGRTDCSEREFDWVGNFPFKMKIQNRKMPEKTIEDFEKKLPIRTFDARTGIRGVMKQPSRKMDLRTGEGMEKIKRNVGGRV